MPTDSNGKYRMNSQIARSAIGGKKDAAADPMAAADPNDPTQGQEQSVTITKKADGTYSYSDSDGQKQDVPDLQTAMAQAQQCFGDEGSGQSAQGAGDMGADDGSGAAGGNAGAMGM